MAPLVVAVGLSLLLYYAYAWAIVSIETLTSKSADSRLASELDPLLAGRPSAHAGDATPTEGSWTKSPQFSQGPLPGLLQY